MRIKFLLIAAIAIIQTVSAARLEIFNESGKDLFIQIWYGSGNLPKKMWIHNNTLRTIDSGIHAFRYIDWRDEQRVRGGLGECYFANIPSSRTMLMGTIVLRDGRNFDLNFDANGSSSHKVRSVEAGVCTSDRG